MSEEIIGYRFTKTDGLAHTWKPVYPLQHGTVTTAAIMSCQDCSVTISPMGGGGFYLCPACYNKVKLVNFTKGYNPL
jgi:hypothetical protein